MTDEQRAREFDFECTQVDDHDYEDCRKCAGMRQRLVALLASRALEARNEALEEAARVVKDWKFMACSDADGLVTEIRSLAATSKAAGGGQ